MSMKNELAIDEPDFQKLIERNKIYVDKTEIIKRIRDVNGTYYFLSRPRRFGKSLLISTLKHLFQGDKELFKGTYIFNNWNWDEMFPVIHLDLNKPQVKTPEKFEESLSFYIDSIAKNEFNISLEANFSNDKLTELINGVYEKTKKRVVVLVDEYDKPILDKINNTEMAMDIQETLKYFYGILKSSSNILEFVFVTGIGKFSKVSIFSDFNNLIDLTLDDDFSTICGYTAEEVERYFKNFIEKYSTLNNISYDEVLIRIKEHYDGYSWDGKNFIYNPFSLMNFFKSLEFDNYWFESGTPNFLVKIFKNDLNIKNIFKQLVLKSSEFKIFDVENLKQIPLLFQSGYLTIYKKEIINDEVNYTLKIPNNEVEKSITENLFENFISKAENNFLSKKKKILDELKSGKYESLLKYLKKEIVNTPYQIKIRNWKYYQTLIYFIMKSLGFETQSEISMFSGRLDIAIDEIDSYYPFNDEKGNVIIIEVKYTQQRAKNIESLSLAALNQIKEKYYYDIYDEESNIIIIGLAIKEIELKLGGSKIEMDCKSEKLLESNF
ncbi:MAG: ATP-binding protein [Methanobrevibacter sp.]|nr:ATP-binding protein [Methanobrevibacter sp.]